MVTVFSDDPLFAGAANTPDSVCECKPEWFTGCSEAGTSWFYGTRYPCAYCVANSEPVFPALSAWWHRVRSRLGRS